MIQSISFPAEDIEKGIVLTFQAPGNSIVSAPEYFYYFEVVQVLPAAPAPTITFDPPSASYSMVADKNFKPKIVISVKTTHSSECKILCRLTIKNRFNITLYTDYLLITSSPKATISFNCTLLASNVASNIGPNGGSLLRLDDPSAGIEITPSMIVKGEGIPTDKIISVRAFVGQTNIVELSELIPTTRNITDAYSFTRQIKCVSPELIEARSTAPSYIVLNSKNNWTYSYQNKTIVKFVRDDMSDNSIVVFLPVKNLNTLPNNDESSDLPQAPIVKIKGRVSGDTNCISQLVFE